MDLEIDHSRPGAEKETSMPPSRVLLISSAELDRALLGENRQAALGLPLCIPVKEAAPKVCAWPPGPGRMKGRVTVRLRQAAPTLVDRIMPSLRIYFAPAILIPCLCLGLAACDPDSGSKKAAPATGPRQTAEIILTAARGERQAAQDNVVFRPGRAAGVVLEVFPDQLKQTIEGIGTSFTESSAYVLAHLDPPQRREVMAAIYGEQGANFTLARTHIGSCDFSVEGKYSYLEAPGDTAFASFSIAPDSQGFDPEVHPGIKDPHYDLLPMIKEALAIKSAQGDPPLKIVASAWTAPPWMKDIEDWYLPMTAENNWQGTGGQLKLEYEETYARYLLRYLQAYAAEGVPIWGLTPVNEPHGNNGQWESMNFTAEGQSRFVQEQLGPRLRQSAFADTRLLIYDQNRDGMEHWADTLLPADAGQKYIHGIAVHWYASTVKVYEDVFDRVQARYPGYSIIHTEGCIDDLGKPAPDGCLDPEGRTEQDWFQNDAFWWSKSASDWGYAVNWQGVAADDHPLYNPVHRYARNIIVSLDHWLTGWIDWNIVLDRQGGPNHVGNFCGAPIMIDTATQEIHYTPVYHVLAQLSRSIRPGDRAVQTRKDLRELAPDDIHLCGTINQAGLLSVQVLNTSAAPIRYSLQLKGSHAVIEIPENSVQTVRVQL